MKAADYLWLMTHKRYSRFWEAELWLKKKHGHYRLRGKGKRIIKANKLPF